jgi:peptidoglycan/LPS O-acetylase OafA/YrhL
LSTLLEAWRARRAVGAKPGRRRLEEITESAGRSNNFGLIRLVAASLVVFGHSFDLVRRPEPLAPTLELTWGTIGVLIFFSMSGFLVARSWATGPRLVEFATKRALRLLPALFVSSLVCAVVLGPLVTTEPLRSYLDDPATKTYVLDNSLLQTVYALPNVFGNLPFPGTVNGSLWTLPIEAKAYAFVAVVGLLGLLRRQRCCSW